MSTAAIAALALAVSPPQAYQIYTVQKGVECLALYTAMIAVPQTETHPRNQARFSARVVRDKLYWLAKGAGLPWKDAMAQVRASVRTRVNALYAIPDEASRQAAVKSWMIDDLRCSSPYPPG